MRPLRAWILRLGEIVRRRRRDRELAAELESHLQMHIDDNVRAGMKPEEARRQALIKLGGVEPTKENYRDRRGLPWIESLLQDVRFGLRMLRKSPGFTTVAVLTLALGIGATTATFSVINSVLLKPLPFKNPGQLVDLRESESAPGDFPLDGADYLDWQAQNTTFTSMSLYGYPSGENASGMGAPESASVRGMQANVFRTLGVQPLIGRDFAEGEDQGKHRVVILSYGFWQRHFGGQAGALGKTLQLNNEPYTVIGVMPRWLRFPWATDLFVPMDMSSARVHDRGSHWASAIGRMKPGVSIEQARADLMTISERLIKQYRSKDDTAVHSLIFPLKERLVGNSRSELLILLGAVTLVLLIACANVANLLLLRSTGRQREMAVRAVVGATRWRRARQLLTESILLALAGAVLGLVCAWWGVSALQSAQTLPVPRVNPVRVDVTVLLFTTGVSLVVGILFGLAPALQASDSKLSEELKSSASAVVTHARGTLLRDTLIAGEIAVSLALLVGAGLLLRTFAKMRSANIGVQTKNVLTMNLNVPQAKYKTQAMREQLFNQLLDGIDQIPGVKHAAVSTEIVLAGRSNGYVTVPGATKPALARQLVENNYITPDYFKTFGIPLAGGRTFTAEDMQQEGELSRKLYELFTHAKNPRKVKVPESWSFAVVINQKMARTFWPKQESIGKSFTAGAVGGAHAVVIGVVGNERQWGIRHDPVPEIYVPFTMALAGPRANAIISVRTAVAPAVMARMVRGRVQSLDNTLAPFHVRTMNQVVADDMQNTSLSTLLLGVFAALALLLAALGLYGVMSYGVMQRTREIGIRMAIGAQRRDVLKSVMGRGAKLVSIGIVLGTAAALALTRVISALLFAVSATDPLTFTAVVVVLLIVALAACWIPARRAMRVDPMVALRHE